MSYARVVSKPEVIKWDLNYSVGITEIDIQHRMITMMLNELNQSLLQEKDRQDTGKELKGLVSYIREHISTEDRLFHDYAYPFSASHQNEHQIITLYLETLSHDYNNGIRELNSQTLQQLGDWIKDHFVRKDRTYSYFFIRKGLI